MRKMGGNSAKSEFLAVRVIDKYYSRSDSGRSKADG